MSNIFIHEIRRHYITVIVWTVIAIGVMVIFAGMYPSFKDQADSFMELLKTYPPEMLKVLGIDSETFSSPIGFYSFTTLYVILILTIFASSIGLRLFSFEKTHRINEYLFAKPVKRTSIFLSKYIVGIFFIFVSFWIYAFAAFGLISLISGEVIDFTLLLRINMTIFISMFFFYNFSVFMATIVPKMKVMSAYSMLIVFGFYFLTILYSVLEIDYMKYLSPFSMFQAKTVLTNGFETEYVVYVLSISVILAIISYIMYIRKDIK